MYDEVELKLTIDRKDAARLRRHHAIANACTVKSTKHKILSLYYDTPDLKLLDAGITLRVRHVLGQWIQSVKSTDNSLTGLHQRSEWEYVIATKHLDFTKILNSKLIKLFEDPKLRDSLLPIFQTEMLREEWKLVFDNGDRIELALDFGQLIAGQNHEPITEIELELKGGHVGRLFDLALELLKDIPLTLENTSKAQRGYAYYRTKPPSVLYARPPKLKKDIDVHSAFMQISWECIRQLQGNQNVVLHGTDVEGVHQMRVALRRLRSAFLVFKNILGGEHNALLLAELSWLTGVLGKTRDLDVLLTQTFPAIFAQFNEPQCLLKLRDKAIVAQVEAYNELSTTLTSQRYQRLLLTLASWLENESWRTKSHEDRFVKAINFSSAILAKRYKHLLMLSKDLIHMSPQVRHSARISAKKLRYAAEFFSSLYTTKKSRPFIQSLSQLQDCLGVLNDINSTDKLLHQLVGPSSDITPDKVLNIFASWNNSQSIHFEEKLNDALRKFVSQKPFWN
jgi:inorganic triphosphatase YgiF